MATSMKDVALILTNMNKLNAKKVAQIAAKLGWLKMPANVVTNAVLLIVRNYINTIADCCDESICEDTALECILELNATDIYLQLFIDDYHSLNDVECHNLELSLRGEIEELMLKGYTFEEARREYDV